MFIEFSNSFAEYDYSDAYPIFFLYHF